MPADVKGITMHRKAERDKTATLELRQVLAIEQVADQLEAIRQELAAMEAMLPRLFQGLGPRG